MAKSKGKNATAEKEVKLQTPKLKKKDKGLKAEKIKQAVAKTPPVVVKNATPNLKKQKQQNQASPVKKVTIFGELWIELTVCIGAGGEHA